MTLDCAIEHSLEVVESVNCPECAREHFQLFRWLNELRVRRILDTEFSREYFKELCGDDDDVDRGVQETSVRGFKEYV